jgi:hypothetical protein
VEREFVSETRRQTYKRKGKERYDATNDARSCTPRARRRERREAHTYLVEPWVLFGSVTLVCGCSEGHGDRRKEEGGSEDRSYIPLGTNVRTTTKHTASGRVLVFGRCGILDTLTVCVMEECV